MYRLQRVALGILLVLMPLLAGCSGGEEATNQPSVSNRAPVPTAPDITIAQDTSGTSQVSANDPDTGETFTFAITAAPLNGTARVSASGLVTYTPDPAFNGTDSLIVTVTDNGTPPLSGTVTINITVTPAPIDLTGVASKGPLVGRAVRVFVLNPNGTTGTQVAGDPGPVGPNELQPRPNNLSLILTQAPDGSWRAPNIPGTFPRPFTIDARRDATLAPTCSYLDESMGRSQSLGTATIKGILPTGESTAAITPLTDAVARAVQTTLVAAAAAGRSASPAVVTTNTIANAAQTFGFDPVRTLPPDPSASNTTGTGLTTVLQQATTGSAAQQQLAQAKARYAEVLAGLDQILTASSGGTNASTDTIATNLASNLNTMSQDLATHGQVGTNLLSAAGVTNLQAAINTVATSSASTSTAIAQVVQAATQNTALQVPTAPPPPLRRGLGGDTPNGSEAHG